MCSGMDRPTNQQETPSSSSLARSDSNNDRSDLNSDHRLLLLSHRSTEGHPDTWPASTEAQHVESTAGDSSVILEGRSTYRVRESRRNVIHYEDDFSHIGALHDDGAGPSSSPSPPLASTLEQKIRNQIIKRQEECFIPINMIEGILNHDNVQAELDKLNLQIESSNVVDDVGHTKDESRQRIFAILCMLGKVPEMANFIEEKIFDRDLPFEFEYRASDQVFCVHEGVKVQIRLFASGEWHAHQRDSFEHYQWYLLAPIFDFSYGPEQRVLEYRLHDRIVLPFVKDVLQTVSGLDLSLQRQGGCSIVRKVQIHHAHYNEHHRAKARKPSYFAVKELHAREGKETHREARALRRLNEIQHPHLIRLLATYIHRDRVHMIFPWASGNLEEFWRKNPDLPSEPLKVSERVKWMCTQILGLAQGLQKIHRCEIPKWSEKNFTQEDVIKSYGRHGDLKPHNILWFQSEDEPNANQFTSILKVADFGFADFRSPHSKSGVPGSAVDGFTPTYEAPELPVKNLVSPAYDIWSFGCILLQFAVWYLRGWEGVDEFSKKRADEGKGMHISADNFFNVVVGSTRKKLAARMKTAVHDEFETLKKHANCSDLLLDLLEFVQLSMLRVKPEMRADINTVVDRFAELNRRHHEDETYGTQKRKSPRKVLTDLSEIYEESESPDVDRSEENFPPVAPQSATGSIESADTETRSSHAGTLTNPHKTSDTSRSPDNSQGQRPGEENFVGESSTGRLPPRPGGLPAPESGDGMAPMPNGQTQELPESTDDAHPEGTNAQLGNKRIRLRKKLSDLLHKLVDKVVACCLGDD